MRPGGRLRILDANGLVHESMTVGRLSLGAEFLHATQLLGVATEAGTDTRHWMEHRETERLRP